jgi:hypothetical protein
LFANLVNEDPKVGIVAIEDVEKVEGEARANNRYRYSLISCVISWIK